MATTVEIVDALAQGTPMIVAGRMSSSGGHAAGSGDFRTPLTKLMPASLTLTPVIVGAGVPGSPRGMPISRIAWFGVPTFWTVGTAL